MSKRNTPLSVGVPQIPIRNDSHSQHSNIYLHQYKSYTASSNHPARDAQDQRIDKLSLIFQNEPKEIQQKLVNLLIRYNAMMQYVLNRDQDMFEVDLLIPFENDEHKKQFMAQFLEIRRQKNNPFFMGDTFGTPQQKAPQEIEWIGSYNEVRRFSFQSQHNNEFTQLSEADNIGNDSRQTRSRKTSRSSNKLDKNGQALVNNQTESAKEVVPIVEVEKVEQKIDFQALQEIIGRRLKVAVGLINLQKENKIGGQSNYLEGNTVLDRQGQEASIIDQISNSISLASTEKIAQSKNRHEDSPIDLQPSLYYSNDQHFSTYRKGQEVHYATEKPHYMEITEEPQEEDYQPLFSQENKQKKPLDGKVTAFEDYAKRYASIKEAKNVKNIAKSINNTARQPKAYNNYASQRTAQSSMHSQKTQTNTKKAAVSYNVQDSYEAGGNIGSKKVNMENKDKNRVQKKEYPRRSQEVKKINDQINIFINTYRRSLDKIYSQIRQRIGDSHVKDKGQQTPEKSIEDLYILVCDDQPGESENLSVISEEAESATFKDEMIKQYHKEILVTNRNLSSQDLVHYFRYLHGNAKKLYLKYLKNRVK